MNQNVIVAVAIVLAGFLIVYLFKKREGFESKTSSSSTSTSSSTTNNGMAGNASSYAAGIQTMATNIQDQLLITKYRDDYENTILAYDNLINAKMLQTLMNTNASNPNENLTQIANLSNAKNALNSIMKYIDSQ